MGQRHAFSSQQSPWLAGRWRHILSRELSAKGISVVRENRKSKLLGVGLDGSDGHVRLTRGDNFDLVGGSEQTHKQMQEKCIKLNEKLKDRGRQLEDLEHAELHDLAQECEINLLQHPRQGR